MHHQQAKRFLVVAITCAVQISVSQLIVVIVLIVMPMFQMTLQLLGFW